MLRYSCQQERGNKRKEVDKKMKRKKILITSLALTFSLSVGTVFASSNAGSRLQQWYEEKFQQSVSDINENTLNPMVISMSDQINDYAEDLSNDANARLDKNTSDTIWYHIGSIFIHNGRYIDQIRIKQDEIKNNSPSDFDSYVSGKNNEIDMKLKEITEDLLTDINNDLDKVVKDVSLDLQKKSGESQKDLIKTISNAKSDIIKEIEGQESVAELDLTSYIDEKINQSKSKVESHAITYSNEKIIAINEQGNKLKNGAYSEMLIIISNINK